MSLNTYINIKGVGANIPVASEYTNVAVVSAFVAAATPIVNLFNAAAPNASNPNPGPLTLTQTDVDNVIAALGQLQALAATPTQVTLSDGSTSNAYITYEMGTSIDQLVRSFEAVGFLSPGGQTVSNLSSWLNLSQFGLQPIMQALVNAPDANHTLQSLLSLVYVKQGNEILFNNLSQLKAAIQANQDALTTLQAVQALKNSLSAEQRFQDPALQFNIKVLNAFANPPSLSGQPSPQYNDGNPITASTPNVFPFQVVENDVDVNGNAIFTIARAQDNGGTAAVFINDYVSNADPLFKNPIGATVTVDVTAGAVITQYNDLISKLTANITALNIAAGVSTPVPGSLAAQLTQVKNDMLSSPISNWIIDGTGNISSATAGVFQNNLTQAITAGENFNDTNKQTLSSQLFLFQEFYQSASAALASINQNITQIANHISG